MVELRAITEENYLDAFKLDLGEEQKKFVPHPIQSLAEAYIYRERCQPLGIYADDEMIGYVLIVYYYDIPKYNIRHMMIDDSKTGNGFGKAAIEQEIEYIKQKPFGSFDRITHFCNKNDERAMKLYLKMGFAETGIEDGDEIELSMTIGD